MRSRTLVAVARIGLCTVLTCMFVPLFPGVAAATPPPPKTIRVNVAAGSDITGDGTIARPYKTIEFGVAQAIAGDTVRIAPGTYYPPDTIQIPSGVRLIGAGLGRTVVWGAGGPSGPIFNMLNCSDETLIEGLEIHGGGGSSGGAILITDGAPVIQRNDFIDNSVSFYGGAIYMYANSSTCAPVIAHNVFIGNEAVEQGGAIYADHSDPYIFRCSFKNNAASGAAPLGGGGAVYFHEGEGRIERCTFEDNDAPSGNGGAITVQENTGIVKISETLFDGNTSGVHGGAVWGWETYVQTIVRNCRFENNISGSYGGGMRLYNAAAVVEGSSFYGNTANAGVTPGGLDIYDADADQPTSVDSCIFHFNGVDGITNPGTSCNVTVTYSCLDHAQAGTGNIIGQDPLFMASTWALRLWAASPCIDAGNPASTLTTDWEMLARPKDGDGNGVARVDMGSYEYGTTVGRLAGSDRYSTSCAAVQDRFAESPVAIIATGRDFPDALCAAGLAGAYKAPVLLSDTSSLPASVRAKLIAMETREAIIVGGTGVISQTVVTALEAMGIDVTRISGADRYATSRAVADHLAGMGYTESCYVARGDDFPDALALAPLAAQFAGPVLLTQTNSLPSATLGALRSYGYEYALVAGGTSAVSAAVYDAIKAEIPADQTWRAQGANRYETAAAVAKWAWDADLSNGEFVGLAVGDNFPDALAGGAACGYERGVLLLTTKDSLHAAAADYLDDRLAVRREVWVLGGTAVISDTVLADCRNLLP
ncbi:cell wall-binding repeat-containing protein [Anaerosoma tenue]|uniref:cell wall-binding repeat-containing protein n=1 Tax=Anaerosoma tenue TaxID=2933588 RepID=UPI002260EDF7|nr:cell wall-binding repeat-containing protein [Anaerosoma tenue]MCK8114889.1 cell wall-binding repeat-containing protein [Anaerosoma tenue]